MNRDVDPMAAAADMGIAQAMIGRGVEALMRIDEPHARGQEQDAVAEIADESELVGLGCLGPAADFALADAAEGFVEAHGVRRRPRPERLRMVPRRTLGIDAASLDGMEEIEQVGGIRRVRAVAPQVTDHTA